MEGIGGCSCPVWLPRVCPVLLRLIVELVGMAKLRGGVRFHWTDLSGLFSHANLAEGEVAQFPQPGSPALS